MKRWQQIVFGLKGKREQMEKGDWKLGQLKEKEVNQKVRHNNAFVLIQTLDSPQCFIFQLNLFNKDTGMLKEKDLWKREIKERKSMQLHG